MPRQVPSAIVDEKRSIRIGLLYNSLYDRTVDVCLRLTVKVYLVKVKWNHVIYGRVLDIHKAFDFFRFFPQFFYSFFFCFFDLLPFMLCVYVYTSSENENLPAIYLYEIKFKWLVFRFCLADSYKCKYYVKLRFDFFHHANQYWCLAWRKYRHIYSGISVIFLSLTL